MLYQVDEFSRMMGVIFGLIGAAAVLYAHSSEADGTMTAAALGYVGTGLGAVFAGDWLTLVFFWELMAATSTLLVWHYGSRAVRTGFRYAMAPSTRLPPMPWATAYRKPVRTARPP